MPVVSVVCAAWNRGAAIRATIDSVRRQTLDDFEMLVVSDGSTDDTDDHVAAAAREDPRVRLLRIDHSGHPSRAMNAGVAAGSGEVVAYIDHDDFWEPRHLEALVGLLDDGADVAAAGSTWVEPDGRVLSQRPAIGLLWHHEIQVMSPVFENSQAAHRAEWARRVGPWREGAHGLEDWDMWLRLADAGARFRTIAAPTVRKTMTRTNRHRRLRGAHVTPLATFPDAASARRCLQAMVAPEGASRLASAATEDLSAWYGRLSQMGGLVFPVGFAQGRETSDARLTRALAAAREADRGLEDRVHLRLEPVDGGVAVTQEISCMTADHAARYRALARQVQVRQFDVVQDLATPLGGVVDGRVPA